MKKSLAIALLLVGLVACSEKESPSACDYQRDLDAFVRRVETWSANPTAASCEDMRKSAIELLNRIRGCPGAVNVEQTLEDWRDIDCSPYDLL